MAGIPAPRSSVDGWVLAAVMWPLCQTTEVITGYEPHSADLDLQIDLCSGPSLIARGFGWDKQLKSSLSPGRLVSFSVEPSSAEGPQLSHYAFIVKRAR